MRRLTVLVSFMLAISGAITILTPVAAVSATYVVDDDGTASAADCNAADVAYTLIQDAIDVSTSGDAVQVCPGAYVEAINIDTPLTLTGMPGAVIKPDNSTPLLDGGLRRAAVYVDTTDNVTIQGFEVDGTGGTVNIGIYGFNSDNTAVKNNFVHGMVDDAAQVSGLGIIFYGWGQAVDNNLVRNNTVSHTDHHGIWMGAVDTDGVTPIDSENNVVENNTVHHTWQNSDALPPSALWGGAIGMDAANGGTIRGNYVHSTGSNQREIMLVNGAYDVSLTNNTLLHSGVADWTQPAIELAAYPGSNGLTITGNTITATPNSADGGSLVVYLPDVAGANSFSNNTLELMTTLPPSFYNGLALDGSLTGNWTISGNEFTGSDLSAGGAAIRLYDGLPSTSAITISGNDVTGWANGIRTSDLADAELLSVHGNRFSGNSSYGVLNGGSDQIDATRNWWGDISGPSGEGFGDGDAVSVNVTYEPWCFNIACTLFATGGTDGADTLVGTSAANIIFGFDGADVIKGLAGADRLYGGLGDDVLKGAKGADFLSGGEGDDVLKGGKGADSLFGDEDDDYLNGGAGPDSCTGGPGSDTVTNC